MHYHLEIVLPKDTVDINAAVASVMRQFDENAEGDDCDSKYSFWNFYIIGGRYAGTKTLAKYDKERLDAFQQWLSDSKITVSGFVAGKQKLSPASQIPLVDAKWNEMFPHPSGNPVPCPMFKHSNDQYGKACDGTIDGGISRLADSLDITCSRIIFAGPSFAYDDETNTGERNGPLEAVFMLSDSMWNGVNHMDIVWDNTIRDALKQFNERASRFAEEYRQRMTPCDESICVTVDYHS